MFFRFTTAGESHGQALVAIVEGLPHNVSIDISRINHELWRRQQGYGRGGRQKIERDEVKILSGVRHGKTLGSPVALMIENKDWAHWTEVMSVEEIAGQPKNAREVKRPRPGHADLAGGMKFKAADMRDILERASARETAARVACGALAKQLLLAFGVEVRSHVIALGGVQVSGDIGWDEICSVTSESPLACADAEIEKQMIAAVDQAKENGDTLGGVFEVVAKGVPVGLGSHTSWSEKLDGRISQAIVSIQAVKAAEIGSGVRNAAAPGSQVHDEIVYDEARGYHRLTNNAGGLEGGITNGEELRVRGYMKPIATLRKALRSVDIDSKEESLAAFERSDITAVPAAGVIGEAMLAIVLANAMREKFGGDSLDEMRANFDNYTGSLRDY